MELAHDWTTLDVDGRAVPAYGARPALAEDGVLPGVVVIHEIWGVERHIQSVCERLATAGYQTLAPDFWADGGERPPHLTPARVEQAKAFLQALPGPVWADPVKRAEAIAAAPEPARGEIGETLGRLFGPDEGRAQRFARYAAILHAAVARLRATPAAAARPVAAIGFCLGGGLAFRLACEEPTLAAAVSFYGVAPEPAALAHVRCPLLGIYGGHDARITDGVPALEATMRDLGKTLEVDVLQGAPHAFFNDTSRAYRPDPARRAWAHTLSFLARTVPAR